jgi:hypothetical protein
MSARIVRCHPAERGTVWGGGFPASRQRSPIALAIVKGVIDVTIEAIGPVKPRPGADKYAARKPFGAIIAIRRAVVRRRLIVSVRADRWADSDARGIMRSGAARRQ